MVSTSITYTLLFIMGFLLLIDSMHASSVHNKGDRAGLALDKNSNYDDDDDTSLSLKKRDAEFDNSFPDEFQGVMLGKRRFAGRGVRLPSESILLGKRGVRFPSESILLGKRGVRFPSESILLGKRRIPVEAVLLGRRNTPHEDALLANDDK